MIKTRYVIAAIVIAALSAGGSSAHSQKRSGFRSAHAMVPAPVTTRDGANENWDYSLGRVKDENGGGN